MDKYRSQSISESVLVSKGPRRMFQHRSKMESFETAESGKSRNDTPAADQFSHSSQLKGDREATEFRGGFSSRAKMQSFVATSTEILSVSELLKLFCKNDETAMLNFTTSASIPQALTLIMISFVPKKLFQPT